MLAGEQHATIRNLRHADTALATTAVADTLGASAADLLVVMLLAAGFAASLLAAAGLFATAASAETGRANDMVRGLAVGAEASAEHESCS